MRRGDKNSEKTAPLHYLSVFRAPGEEWPQANDRRAESFNKMQTQGFFYGPPENAFLFSHSRNCGDQSMKFVAPHLSGAVVVDFQEKIVSYGRESRYPDMKFVFNPGDWKEITCYVDANWGGEQRFRRSIARGRKFG